MKKINKGETVRIVSVKGLQIKVEKLDKLSGNKEV